jgi:signal transduction histidine kinase
METLIRVLVENALQNTYTGHVSVRLLSAQGEPLRLEVEDTGRGIPSDEIEHIFEPFYQVGGGDLSRGDGGLGLGLAIAQRLCARLGYDIEVESVEDSGTLFRVGLRERLAKSAAG